MDDMDTYLKRLAAQAHSDTAPEVDVSHRVLDRLRRERWPVADKPLTVFALASVAVAIAVVSVSISVLDAAMDPFEILLQVAPVLIQ